MKIIATKEPQNLVYIDESGIDNTEDYPYGYCQKGQRFYALKSGKKFNESYQNPLLTEQIRNITNSFNSSTGNIDNKITQNIFK